MLTKFGDFLYRERVVVLLTALALLFDMCIFGLGVFHLTKSGGYDNPASESTQARHLLDTKLGGSFADVIIFMQSQTLHVDDPAFARKAEALLSPLQTYPGVVSLTSYYSTHNQAFVSRDAHETFALLQLASQDLATKQSEYQRLLPLLISPSPLITVSEGGDVPVNMAVNQQVNEDLARAEMLTLPILALLLLLVFGGVIAALLPLLTGGAAILGAFTLLRLLTKVTDVSVYAVNVVTMLGLGLAIDYALLIVTRFREELAGLDGDVHEALQRTMATAGRTVIFSALTISTSLMSLLLFPLTFLRSIGLGAISAVMVVMLTSLTLLPSILALLGPRVNALSFTRLWRRRRTTSSAALTEHRGSWYRLSEIVMRWPMPVALVVLAVLLVLGWPFLHITFATPDENILPPGQPARVVSQRIAQDFTEQGNAELMIAVALPQQALSAESLSDLNSYVKSIAGLPGVEHITSLVTVEAGMTLAQYQHIYADPSAHPDFALAAQQLARGNLTKVTVELQPMDHSDASIRIVNEVRALPTTGGLKALVDGITPEQIDLMSSLETTLPVALLVIVASIFVLLFLMTGSLIMPLKAILLNTLSLSATFGGLVWIFQDGHLQQVLNFQSPGSIDATQPVLIFAIAFGLSMDYEVFLLSRIKERFDQTGNNRLAVSSGLQRTGGLITSEALLLAVVLGAFGMAKIIFIQEIGIGLAIAVVMDATLIRMLLVPSTMRLLGNLNWWAPAPLTWLWQRIGLVETPLLSPEEIDLAPTQPLREIWRRSA
jgi:RND superfamily putative drug exporter